MPRSSRYNVYIEEDTSSMVKEIKTMCGGLPQDSVEKVFIVVYRKPDVLTPNLFQEDMKRWWNPTDGRQKQLAYFANADQLISFDNDLNDSQLEAISRFTGWQLKNPKNQTTEKVLFKGYTNADLFLLMAVLILGLIFVSFIFGAYLCFITMSKFFSATLVGVNVIFIFLFKCFAEFGSKLCSRLLACAEASYSLVTWLLKRLLIMMGCVGLCR
jgi:hypothetical protein